MQTRNLGAWKHGLGYMDMSAYYGSLADTQVLHESPFVPAVPGREGGDESPHSDSRDRPKSG